MKPRSGRACVLHKGTVHGGSHFEAPRWPMHRPACTLTRQQSLRGWPTCCTMGVYTSPEASGWILSPCSARLLLTAP